MTFLLIWFLAPVLLGALSGFIVGVAIGALVDAVVEYTITLPFLNKKNARNISKEHLSEAIGVKLKNNDFNIADFGLTNVIVDCGDEEWDIRKAFYDEDKKEFLCVTKINFDSVSNELKNELLAKEVVIL